MLRQIAPAVVLLASYWGVLAQDTGALSSAYDGRWNVVLTCTETTDKTGLIKGYDYAFFVDIAAGKVHGQYGAPGHAASATYDGVVHADGKLEIKAIGKTGKSEYAVGKVRSGTRYGYDLQGQLQGSGGQAVRTSLRPCTAVFTRQQQ